MAKRNRDLVRTRIIEAAVYLFSRHGFDATSFEAIAKRAKVSSTSPFYYFANKQKLFAAVLELVLVHNSELVKGAIQLEDDAITRLKKHFQMNLILEVLYAGISEGSVSKDIDPVKFAEILHDTLLGGIVNAVSTKLENQKAFDDVQEKWDLLISRTLRSAIELKERAV